MPEPNKVSDDIFIEIEGVKYKADPDNPEQALMGEDKEPIPFEETPDETEETEDQKKERLEKERKEQEEEDKKDPPLRKSVKDRVIDRKTRKIKKLKKEIEDDEDEESEEFTKEGKALIDKKIEEGLKPILDRVRGQRDEQELQTVLKKYGKSAEKLENKIEKYMKAYPSAPVEFIFLGLAYQEVLKTNKKKEADEEAAKTATGGSQKRPKKIAKIPDVSKLDDKQMGALIHEVMTGEF